MMKHWMVDVVACSDGTEVSAQAARNSKNTIFRYARSRFDPWKARTGSSRRSFSRAVLISPGPVCFSDRLPSGIRSFQASWMPA